MSTKALRKELFAAVAMLIVAAIALSGSTYAWFVSNNQVTATTSMIHAQSNAAYLVIDNAAAGQTSSSSGISVTASESTTTTALYPAQIVENGVWKSAYAQAPSAATEKANTRFTIGENGTAAEAVASGYAIKNTFYIGTGGYDGAFENLVVTGVAVTATPAASELTSAVRVLIVNHDTPANWVVWKNGSQVTTYAGIGGAVGDIITQATNGVLASSIVKGTDVTLDVYVYYDGADVNVFSDNLPDLKSCDVTITFDATPVAANANP